MPCHKKFANLVNLVALSLISCSVNVIGVPYIPTKVPDQITPQGERVDISIFNFNHLKEIDHDTYQVIGNPSRVELTCQSTKNDSEFVNWKYHGLSQDVDLQTTGNEVYVNLTSGPPVARMECILHSNQSISNSTLIYRGDDKAPYLYNHGKSVRITVLNETTARLPCLLNYPLENKTNLKLTLLKDGKEVESDCLSYSPEYGYFLNLTKLEEPYGKYECKVVNSTKDDVVSMTLGLDDITRAEVVVQYNGPFKFFWEGESVARVFECKVPKSKFQEKFHWFYLYDNDVYEPITPEKSTKQVKPTPESQDYIDRVRINFPNRNITHVVCAAYLQKDDTSYNNTLAVQIKEPQNPKIVNGPLKGPIIYEEGRNLTCASVGDPIDFHWLKNGKPVQNQRIHFMYASNPVKKSVLLLNPPEFDEKQMNYTCVVKNSVTSETLNFTFPVQLPEEPVPNDQNQTLLITIGVVLAAIVILLLLMITFFKIKFERRRFGDEKIKRFFNGIGGTQQVPYNSHVDEPDSIDSVSYDTSREINFNSLNFVRELKGGNFGKVEFGYYVDTNTGQSMEVAIKSMKDQPKASKEDMDFAFENFLMEIKIMQILDTKHPNVVAYLGAVTSDLSRYSAYLVVEYCHGGDLSSYIKSLKKDGGSFHDDIQGRHYNLLSASGRNDGTVGSMHGIVLRTSVLMKWCEQVACALDYIASKNLVHRDIAARNVLLAYREHSCNRPDPERMIAKISDFGLSKDLHELPKDYYQIVFYSDPKRNRPRQLPLRWISLEALETLKFTTQSDVWAFGVLMWEMFTLGEIPYREITEDGDVRYKLITHLKNGNTLPEPAYAPIPIWEIMEMCWSELPNRPDFRVIKQMLHAINDNRENNVYTKQEAPLPAIGYSTVCAIQNSPYYPTLDLGEYEDGQSDLNDEEDQHLPVCTCNNEGHSRDCACNYTSLRLQYV